MSNFKTSKWYYPLKSKYCHAKGKRIQYENKFSSKNLLYFVLKIYLHFNFLCYSCKNFFSISCKQVSTWLNEFASQLGNEVQLKPTLTEKKLQLQSYKVIILLLLLHIDD